MAKKMFINTIRILFLFSLYFTNISVILSIYPILFNIIRITTNEINWYHLGLIFSIYELGKFTSIPLWEYLSNSKSIIILVLLSLSLITILNISFCFISKLFHILIIRFFLGFCNHTGAFFKSIYIQMGFKRNNKIIIFLISNISTSIALFFPSIIIKYNIGENLFKVKNIKLKNILFIYIIMAFSNLLSLILGFILLYNNKLKTNDGFYKMNISEKTENSMEGPIKPQKSNIVDIDHKSNSKIINVNNQKSDRNISNQNKFSNDTDTGINKSEKNSDNKDYNLNRNDTKNNIFNNHKNKSIYIKSKQIQFCFVQILINLVDGLSLIWTLIILYIQFQEKCLTISIYISILKVLGEIILFPINDSITKNSSFILASNLYLIVKKMKIINIISFLVSICISQIIFSIYYYSKYNNILVKILFVPLLIRTILSGIFTQLNKIYCDKYFKNYKTKDTKLKLYNQYFGSFSKSLIYIIGSFGLIMIGIIVNKNNILELFTSIIYFQLFPQIIYILLFISCFKFFN